LDDDERSSIEFDENYVIPDEQKLRNLESIKKQLKDSWDDYVHTGLHITQDELGEWIRQRKLGNPIEFPKVHQ
jgi:hypothetical protein